MNKGKKPVYTYTPLRNGTYVRYNNATKKEEVKRYRFNPANRTMVAINS